MNKIILMGRLTRDPEISYVQGGGEPLAIARYSIAVDRRFKGKSGEQEADFFNCTTFGKQAEFVEKYLKKGTKITLVGRLQNNNYTNKDGQKVYSVQIITEEIDFAESKTTAEAEKGETAPANGDGFINIPDGIDEELPFN